MLAGSENPTNVNMDKVSNSQLPPRTKFTKEEDAKLLEIYNSSPNMTWKKLASSMGNRTARQCRERYNNYLAPHINHDPWTPQEDEMLKIKYAEYGPQWSLLTSFFNNRSCVNIKNHFSKISHQMLTPMPNRPASVTIDPSQIHDYLNHNIPMNSTTHCKSDSLFMNQMQFTQSEPHFSLLPTVSMPQMSFNTQEQVEKPRNKFVLPSISGYCQPPIAEALNTQNPQTTEIANYFHEQLTDPITEQNNDENPEIPDFHQEPFGDFYNITDDFLFSFLPFA